MPNQKSTHKPKHPYLWKQCFLSGLQKAGEKLRNSMDMVAGEEKRKVRRNLAAIEKRLLDDRNKK